MHTFSLTQDQQQILSAVAAFIKDSKGFVLVVSREPVTPGKSGTMYGASGEFKTSTITEAAGGLIHLAEGLKEESANGNPAISRRPIN